MNESGTTEERFIFGAFDAAQFLGVALATVKHHIYNSKKLVPDGTTGKGGKTIFFYRPTLEDFRDRKSGDGPWSRLYRYVPGQGIKAVQSA